MLTRRLRCAPLADSAEKTAAASVDDRAEKQRDRPIEAEEMCGHRRRQSGERDTNRREDGCCPRGFANRARRRVQATVEQDQYQRGGPDLEREVIVLEWNPRDAFRAGEHTKNPRASGTPNRADVRLNVTANTSSSPNEPTIKADANGSAI